MKKIETLEHLRGAFAALKGDVVDAVADDQEYCPTREEYLDWLENFPAHIEALVNKRAEWMTEEKCLSWQEEDEAESDIPF